MKSPVKRIRSLIVDDEPLARDMIAALLATERDVEIVGQAHDGRSALQQMQLLTPDLVFLDVQMPIMSGIEVLRRVPAGARPPVIFVTAYDKFALTAFELHAIDYLLKPYTDERFFCALARMRRQLLQPDAADLTRRISALLESFPLVDDAGRGGAEAQLAAKSGNDIHVFRAAEIKWVEGQGDYLKLHGARGGALVRETMGHFLERVPKGRFARIHKSTIVNLAYIRKLEPIFSGDYRLVLTDGTVLRVSRHYRAELKSFFHEAN